MRRRLLIMALLFPAMLLPTYGYLGWRLSAGVGAAAWLLLALPFVSVLSFIFLVRRRASGQGQSAADRWLSRLAYANMGLVSFLLVATLGRDLLGLASGRWLPPVAVVAVAVLLLLVGGYRGLFGPRVRRVTVRYPSLPPSLRGLRILQISDLHLSSHLRLRYAQRVVRLALGAKPDLITFTGDIGDGYVADLGAEIEALRPLTAVAPVFYVTGNHEVYWNFGEWMEAFRKLGMKVLLNEGERVELRGASLFVGGITDPACETLGLAPDLAGAARGGSGAALRILLSHRPDPAEAAAAAGFDLQLSGHTHGGQFFPWTLVAAAVHRYSLGLYPVGAMWVYVSAGTGSWGPRIRLGTRAEVTLLELI